MLIYNLIEYGDNYSKALGKLWKYYRDESNDTLTDSELFKSKVKKTGSGGITPNNGNTKGVKIAVPLKYLSNSWRSLQMLLINCEINLILTWSKDCVISSATGATKFAITDTKFYVLTLCDLIYSRKCKTITTIEIRFRKKLTEININQNCQ